ncbi:TPA: transcriptional regulator [Streptococcus suis]
MAVAENKKRVVVTLGDEVVKEFNRLADEASLSKSALLTLWINEKRKA